MNTRDARRIAFIVLTLFVVLVLMSMTGCSYAPALRDNPDGSSTEVKKLIFSGTERKLKPNEVYKQKLADAQMRARLMKIDPAGMGLAEIESLLLEVQNETVTSTAIE